MMKRRMSIKPALVRMRRFHNPRSVSHPIIILYYDSLNIVQYNLNLSPGFHTVLRNISETLATLNLTSQYQRPPPLHPHKKKDRKRSHRKPTHQPVSSFRTIDFTKLQQQGIRDTPQPSSVSPYYFS